MKFYNLALKIIREQLGNYPEEDVLVAYDIIEKVVLTYINQYENLKPFDRDEND